MKLNRIGWLPQRILLNILLLHNTAQQKYLEMPIKCCEIAINKRILIGIPIKCTFLLLIARITMPIIL